MDGQRRRFPRLRRGAARGKEYAIRTLIAKFVKYYGELWVTGEMNEQNAYGLGEEGNLKGPSSCNPAAFRARGTQGVTRVLCGEAGGSRAYLYGIITLCICIRIVCTHVCE